MIVETATGLGQLSDCQAAISIRWRQLLVLKADTYARYAGAGRPYPYTR